MNRLLYALGAASLLLLSACPPERGDDDDGGCDASVDYGAVHACIYFSTGDETGLDGASLSARTGPEDTAPIEALAGADGCVEIQLAAGSWELSASNAFGDCVTPWEAYEIVGCETLDLEFSVSNWCMDGR